MKRWIAALLTVAMLMSCLPLNVLAESGGSQAAGYSTAAEETQTQKAAPELDVETGGMTVEATNSFGQLLLDSMDETNGEAEAGQYDEGNKITGLTVEGATAQVDFCTTAEAADLVVAIYTEDETEMLASGTVEVAAGQTSAAVTLEGTMPANFIAKAYLLAKEDHAPISPAFSTSLYTEEMVDLVNSTIYDYDPERVLNLDEDAETNFMVVSQNTVLAEQENGKNIVVENDAEAMHYVIENADENIQNLKPGKTLVCTYGEDNMLIAKVAEIQVDGTTVTIAGENAEISEVFEQIKIQASGTTGDFEVDTSTCSDDLVYEGVVEQETPETENGIAADAYDFLFGDGIKETFTQSETYRYSFKAQHTTETETGDTTSKSDVTISGYLQLKLGAQFAYLLSINQQYVTLTAASDLDGNINVTGTYDKSHQISDFYYSPVFGVYIGLKPQVTVHAKAKIDYTFHANVTVGMAYDSEEGFMDLSEDPVFTSKLTMKGMIEVDLDLHPYAQVAIRLGDEEDKIFEIADINMTTMVGLIIEAEMTGKNFEEFNTGDTSGGSGHECNSCLKAELSYRIKVDVELSLLKDLNIDWLTFKPTIADFTNKISDYYYSFDFKDSGFTTCPHMGGSGTGTGGGTSGGDGSGEIGKDIIASGTCGENATWMLYTSGVLVISGSGTLEDYKNGLAPWHGNRGDILSVVIGEKITSISSGAFFNCSNLTSAKIPESVTTIGNHAFSGCISLQSIKIPTSVTRIGSNAFTNCSSLTSIEIPAGMTAIEDGAFNGCSRLTSVEIPMGVTTIGNHAFSFCNSLTNVAIPTGVTTIGQLAFAYCDKLRNIEIPTGVTIIGERAFESCSGLTSVAIPESVTTIGDWAFINCSSLTSVKIPTGVATIKERTFEGCGSLTSVVIPTGVTTIEDYAFQHCSSLMRVKIPTGVTTIGSSAFNGCSNLTSVEIPTGVTTIGSGAFNGCSHLMSAEIPVGVTTIGDNTFSGCSSLISVVIPKGVTTIGSNAFSGCSSLTSFEIPTGVTTIGSGAFNGCSSLTSIEIPAGVTQIGGIAFLNCSSLMSVVIPKGVTTIEGTTFAGCSSLTSVAIPTSVAKIKYGAFSGCSTLSDVYYGETRRKWDTVVIESNNEALTSANIHYNSTGPDDVTNGIFTGSPAEEPDGWQATFENLVPNMEYAVIVSSDENSPLTAENLQYITQEAANADGTLIVYYCQSDTNAASYVVACGFGKTDPTEPSTPGTTPGGSDSGSGGDSGDKPTEPTTPGTTPGGSDSGNGGDSGNKPTEPSTPGTTPGGSDSGSGGDSGDKPTEPSTPGTTPGGSDSGSGGDSEDKPTEPSTPSKPSTPGTDPGGSGSGSSSGGNSGDGAAAALLLAGAGAVAAVVVARAVLPVEVSGTVTDETGAPLAGATVALWQDGAAVQQAVTDANGWYSVKVKRGEYDLAVSYIDPATGTAFQQTIAVQASDKARGTALDLSVLKQAVVQS